MPHRHRVTGRPGRGTLLRWVGWFAIGHTLLLLALFSRYLTVMPAQGWPARAFLAVAAPGHALTLALVPATLAALVALLVPRRGLVAAVAVTLGSALAVLVAVDTVVFRLYRFHLNAMVWNLLTGGAADDLLPLSRDTWLQGGLQVLALILANALLATLAWRWARRGNRRGGRWVALGAVLVLAAGNLVHTWADAWGYVPVTRQVRFLPHYYPLTAENLLQKFGLAPGTKPLRVPEVRTGSSLAYPLEPLQFPREPRRLNLLVLMVESLRFDFVTPEVTPNLWRFSRDAWRFSRHFSTGNATRFGVFGFFYGLHGTYFHAAMAENQPPVLMEAVADRGYQLGVFTSSPLTSPEFDRTVFAGVRDQIDLTGVDAPSSVACDRIITDRFLGFLDGRAPDAPFFGFLFFDAPHDYNFPRDRPPVFQPVVSAVNHLELDGKRDPVPVRNRMLNSIHYVDTLLGEILEKMETAGLLEETVVIVTGDHGEEFNDNGLGYWGHNGNFSEYQTQVGLVIRWPGREPRQVDHLTHHVDIAPTLLTDLFGATTPPDRYSHGRHLLDPEPRPFVISANWNAFAIRQPDRVDVVEPSGFVDTFHADYRAWPDAPPQPAVMLQAAKELGRFYAR